MTEYLSALAESEDRSEIEIQRLMDVLGVSRREAQARLGLGDEPATGFTPLESRRLHPSAQSPARTWRNYESRYDGDTLPVIDTTEKSDKQVITNAVGAAMVREAMRTPDSELTAQRRAVNRAKEERRGRRW